jgi:Flp pilus assembly secretin CpaC
MRYALAPVALALLLGGLDPYPGAAQTTPELSTGHVRVTARIVVVDRDAFARAGLAYAVLGSDRVRVSRNGRRADRGVSVQVGVQRASAFLEAVRASRWIRSESTQQVLAMSGSEALVSSRTLSVGRRSAHTQGPTLAVIPTVLEDGRVHLHLSARIDDAVTYPWGYGVDGSPAAVETEVVTASGEEVIVGSSSVVQSTRESGILWWGSSEQGRDVLVAVTAHIVTR